MTSLDPNNENTPQFLPVGGASFRSPPYLQETIFVILDKDDWSGVSIDLDVNYHYSAIDFKLTCPEMKAGSAFEIHFSLVSAVISSEGAGLRYRFEKTTTGLIKIQYLLNDAAGHAQSLEGMWINTVENKIWCQSYDPLHKEEWIDLVTVGENVGDTIYWYYNIKTGEWEWGFDWQELQSTPPPFPSIFDRFVMRGSFKDLHPIEAKLAFVADKTGQVMVLEGSTRDRSVRECN